MIAGGLMITGVSSKATQRFIKGCIVPRVLRRRWPSSRHASVADWSDMKIIVNQESL
jgi:hypothetical protein